jgi:23S rRNA (pseudouridine1915-N3)-methyltransferase
MSARLRILAVGTRMPGWVQAGFEDYRKRLPREWALELREIPLARRGADAARAVREEGDALLAAIEDGEYVVAMEVTGRALATPDVARALERAREQGQRMAFLVGGPDGLSDACRARAREQWSLSRLTLPHPLVRILLAEQLYRGWSLLAAHPYHR